MARGTSPAIPRIRGLTDVRYWTNHDAAKAETAPASLVVLGGGAIGLEMAQAFARFATRVTLIEALDRVLAAEEPEASAVVTGVLRAEGIDVRTGRKATRVEAAGESVAVHTDDGAVVRGSSWWRRVVFRAWRVSVSEAWASTSPRGPPTDERMRAGERLWAVGDITGEGLFTHVAMYQAHVAVADILGRDGLRPTIARSPVTFTDPEVGRVGMSEAQARSAGLRVRVGAAEVRQSSRGRIHGPGTPA
jgi:pyruvate/2-oxoglutarate dehydrogenase complex dihydrolipoamide dehydrogenase (E3) component